MSLPSSDTLFARRLVSGFKVLLHPKALRGLIRSHSDHGHERYRRAGISASATLVQKASTIVTSFVSVPLTEHYLGPQRYGIWLTISSLLVWMAITDFGLAGNALVNVLSEAHGNDDRRAAQEYTSSAVWALSAVAVLFAVAGFLSFRFIPWSSVSEISTVPSHEFEVTCALMIVFFIVGLPPSVQNSIYSAHENRLTQSAALGMC
jgi:O-antigen/teichoic acid export membrane protein